MNLAMVEPGHTTGELVFAALWLGFCLVLYLVGWCVFKLAPRVAAILQSRGTAGEVAEAPDRHSWDSHTADAILLTKIGHEKSDEEESDDTAADFVLWTFELDDDPTIRKCRRRMDRWLR